MMNSNELMKDLCKVLKESGWLDKANEFYQNHPEYFHQTDHGGYISSFSLSVSYQPAVLAEVKGVTPCLFLAMGNSCSKFVREYMIFTTGSIVSRNWIDNKIVTEVRCKELNNE